VLQEPLEQDRQLRAETGADGASAPRGAWPSRSPGPVDRERCAAETAAAYSRALGSPSRRSSARPPGGDSR
jgi:hypothetical protein